MKPFAGLRVGLGGGLGGFSDLPPLRPESLSVLGPTRSGCGTAGGILASSA